MAVDFSNRATDITTPVQPEVTVVQPVSRQGELDGLQQMGRGLATGVKVAATWMENKSNNKKANALAQFSVDLNTLLDAGEQGLSMSEIRVKANRRLKQEIMNNPAAEEDILSRYSTFLSQSGVDKILTPGMQQAQIEQAQVETAVENGFLSSANINNPQAVQKAIDDQEKFAAATRELELSSAEYANKLAQENLTAKQRETIQKDAEKKAILGLSKIGATAVPYWAAQRDDIKARASQASSEQERQQIIADGINQMETDYAQRLSAITANAGELDQAKIDQVFQPQRALIDAHIKELSGEYSTEMYKRMSEGAMAQAEALFVGGLTENQRQMVAGSKISQAFGTVLGPQLTTIAASLTKNMEAGNGTGKGADLTPSTPEEEESTRSYLDAMKEMITQTQGEQMMSIPEGDRPQVQSEIDAQMRGILKGVDVFGDSTESADQFQPLIDFFADPVVGKYLQGASIDGQAAARVQQVFQDGYAAQVVPMLRDELKGSTFQGARRRGDSELIPWTEVVEPTIETGRFGFKMKEGVTGLNNQNTYLRNLNKSSFVKVMNKMMMADANINGTNIVEVYNKMAPAVFDSVDMEADESDLEIGDFTDEQGNVTQASEFVPATENENIDARVLARYEGRRLPVSIRNNNMGAISITGNIENSWAAKQPGFVGTSKRPANEGGYYAIYATPEDGVAAASRLLKSYGSRGTNSPAAIVRKWSTDKAAHKVYADTLVEYLNAAGMEVDASTKLDLNDPQIRMAILKAKSAHEAGAGRPVYSDEVFEAGVNRG